MADSLLVLHLSLLLPSRAPLISPETSSWRPTASTRSAVPAASQHRQRSSGFLVHAVVAEKDGPKWWEKNAGPNMIDIHSTKEFLDALGQAGDKLVVVEFYGTWCGSCRALFPKLCKTAEEHPDILFLKVDFDKNKPMCKRLNVRVLPFFHFYRGAEGKLESFSCSLAKGLGMAKECEKFSVIFLLAVVMIAITFSLGTYIVRHHRYEFAVRTVCFVFQRIKEAVATHNTARCSIGPAVSLGDIVDLSDVSMEKPAEATTTK